MKSAKRMASTGGQKIPIAIKFAFFITILVVAFMGVVTMTAVGVVERVQEVGVNESGIQLVETLVRLHPFASPPA